MGWSVAGTQTYFTSLLFPLSKLVRQKILSPLQKFKAHKNRAENDGIPFLLTFEEWYKLWTDSGKFEQRGPNFGQYVMARTGDQGPYAVGNVRICTNKENIQEAHLGRKSPAHKPKEPKIVLRIKRSTEPPPNLKNLYTYSPRSEEVKARMRAGQQKRNAEVRAAKIKKAESAQPGAPHTTVEENATYVVDYWKPNEKGYRRVKYRYFCETARTAKLARQWLLRALACESTFVAVCKKSEAYET